MFGTVSVTKKFEFHAAHRLENHKGACFNLHGHTWYLDVTVSGFVNDYTGMITDFTVLKELVKPTVDKLDHAYLNEAVSFEPTVENLIQHIAREISTAIVNFAKRVSEISYIAPKNLRLVRLRLHETPSSYAEWEPYTYTGGKLC